MGTTNICIIAEICTTIVVIPYKLSNKVDAMLDEFKKIFGSRYIIPIITEGVLIAAGVLLALGIIIMPYFVLIAIIALIVVVPCATYLIYRRNTPVNTVSELPNYLNKLNIDKSEFRHESLLSNSADLDCYEEDSESMLDIECLSEDSGQVENFEKDKLQYMNYESG